MTDIQEDNALTPGEVTMTRDSDGEAVIRYRPMTLDLDTAESYFVSIGQEIPTAALVTAKALIARVRELEAKEAYQRDIAAKLREEQSSCPVCHEPAPELLDHLAANHAGLLQARMQQAHGANWEFQQ